MGQLRDIAIYNSIQKFGGLDAALKHVYPDHTWKLAHMNASKFTKKKSGTCPGTKGSYTAEQRKLCLTVAELYPGEEVKEDYLHPLLRFKGGRKMEIDVFVPSLSLGFEYQVGARHCIESMTF